MQKVFAVSSETSQNMAEALKIARDALPDCTALHDKLNDTVAAYEREQQEQQRLDNYRQAAKEQGDIEVDDDALVSKGDDSGAYVSGWMWVSD